MCNQYSAYFDPEWISAIATAIASFVALIGFFLLIKDGRQKQDQINTLIGLNKQLEKQANESQRQTFYLKRSVEIMEQSLELTKNESLANAQRQIIKQEVDAKKERLNNQPFFQPAGNNSFREGRIELELINKGKPAIELLIDSQVETILINFNKSKRIDNEEKLLIKISNSLGLVTKIKYLLILKYKGLDGSNFFQKIEGVDLNFDITSPEDYKGSPAIKD